MAIATSVVNIFLLLGILLFVLLIPVLVGVYVYRDARRRGMGAALWTLIAVVTPGLVGLIIYLIVRSGYSGRRCPGCKKPVQAHFNLCPHCGTALKQRCDCGEILEPGWQLCPNCGVEIAHPEPKEKEDRGIGWILGAVFFAPVLLIVLLLVLSFATSGSNSGHSITWGRNIQPTEFQGSAEVALWKYDCDMRGPGVYALRTVTGQDDDLKTRYAVYVKDEIRWDVSCGMKEGGFFTNAKVEFRLQPMEKDEQTTNLFYVAALTDEVSQLEVYDANGERMEVQITAAEQSNALHLNNGPDWKARIDVQVAYDVPEAYEVNVHFYAGALLLGSEGAMNADGSPLNKGGKRAGETYQFFAPKDATEFEVVFREKDGTEILRQRISFADHTLWAVPILLERAGEAEPAIVFASVAE